MIYSEIRIWGNNVGVVIWDARRDLAIIEFEKKFTEMEIDLAPITMPLEKLKNGNRVYSFQHLNEITFRKLPGLLADSLPDKFGNRLIDIWLAQNGKSKNDFTPVERLCYVGKRAMGALEFEPETLKDELNHEEIQLNELVEIAKEVIAEKETLDGSFIENKKKALEQIIKIGTSAGGMRPKAVIAIHKTDKTIISGHIDSNRDYEHWILKFDGVQDEVFGDPKGYGIIEYIYYLMATDAGIDMTQCKLLEEGSRSHFMTKRFDRKNGRKIHMQTLAGIAHYDFNDIGSTSYEQLFQVMRKLKLGKDEMEQMYRRLVFNIIGRNQDDHTKNTSFLLAENEFWKLSPAYDITYSFSPIVGRNTNKHQMSVNGKRDSIERKDLIKIAHEINIKKPIEIIEKVKDSVAKWPELASDYELKPDRIKKIGQSLRLDL